MESLISFSSSLTQAYWCHQCKKEFLLKKMKEEDEVLCTPFFFENIEIIKIIKRFELQK